MGYVALVSGGKDSTFALYEALENGIQVERLVAIKARNPESYLYHTRNIHLVTLLSEACEIPITIHESGEDEVGALLNVLRGIGAEGVVFGAIASNYQLSRVMRVCEELEIELYAPLWRRNEVELLRRMIGCMEILVTHVAAEGLDERWLGRTLDEHALEELIDLRNKYGVSVCGEGGEYETLVLDAPFFRKKILVEECEKKWFGSYGTLEIRSAKLIGK